MNQFQKVIIATFLYAPLLLLASCGKKDDDAKKAAQNAIKEFPIITIALQNTTLNLEYPATIQGEQDVEIRPRIDGYIDKICVDEGASVRKGQVLFILDSRQYQENVRSAEANVKVAQAEVSTAQIELNKQKSLVEKNIVSHYQLETAQNSLQSKEASLAQAKATLANAKTNLSFTRIESPTSGFIGSIPYKAGSIVSSNSAQPLTTVANTKNVRVYFSMNEKDFLNLQKNQDGKSLKEKIAKMNNITLLLADGSEYPIKGKIASVSGLVDPNTGAVNFRADFSNPNASIRSGASAVVRVPSAADNAVIIPQKSTYEIQGKKFVYVCGDDGKATSQEVKVMKLNSGQTYVVTEGLKAGDKIVAEGVNFVKNGNQIKPKFVNADSLMKSLSIKQK